jgi:hypothetical protein
MLKRDIPEEYPELDFDFVQYAESLADYFLDISVKPPITLLINGEYGSGKSSLMKGIERFINSKCGKIYHERQKGCNFICPNPNPPHRLCRTFWFNPWEYQHEDAIVNIFFYNLIHEAGIKEKLDNDLKNAFEGLEVNLGHINLGGINLGPFKLSYRSKKLSDLKPVSSYPAADIFLEKENAEKILNIFLKCGGDSCKDKPLNNEIGLIVFIDDLDRCEGNKMLNLIGIIKRLMDAMGDRCFFVFGLDIDGAKKIIKNQNKELDDIDSYFNKIFNACFTIPVPLDNKFDEWTNKYFDSINQNALKIMRPFFKKNPRKAKMMVNNYAILKKILKDAEPMKLAAWIVLTEDRKEALAEILPRSKLGNQLSPAINDRIKELGIEVNELTNNEVKLFLRFYGRE